MDGSIDIWIDWFMDGLNYWFINGLFDVCIDLLMDGWIYWLMDRFIYGWLDI